MKTGRQDENDKKKGTKTQSTCQKKRGEGHSIEERVWYSASHEPPDTLPGSQQPCIQTNSASTINSILTLRVSGFSIGTVDVAYGVLGLTNQRGYKRLKLANSHPRRNLNLVRLFRFSLPLCLSLIGPMSSSDWSEMLVVRTDREEMGVSEST